MNEHDNHWVEPTSDELERATELAQALEQESLPPDGELAETVALLRYSEGDRTPDSGRMAAILSEIETAAHRRGWWSRAARWMVPGGAVAGATAVALTVMVMGRAVDGASALPSPDARLLSAHLDQDDPAVLDVAMNDYRSSMYAAMMSHYGGDQ